MQKNINKKVEVGTTQTEREREREREIERVGKNCDVNNLFSGR